MDPRGPDSAQIAVGMLDERGHVVSWGTDAQRLMGYRAEDMEGQPLAGLLADGYGLTSEDLVRGGYAGSVALRHRNGGTVQAEFVVRPWESDDGPVRAVWLIRLTPWSGDGATDLVEWGFEQIPFTGGIHDLELRLTQVNEHACRAWNLSRGEMLGKGPADLLPPDVGPEVTALMRRAVRTGESVSMETFLRLPGGPEGHAWVQHFTPLKDPDGQVRALYSLGIDITAEYLARRRLALLSRAGRTVGSSLNTERTAHELAEALVPEMADLVTVDLLTSVLSGQEPVTGTPRTDSVTLRRIAQLSVIDGCPEATLRLGDIERYPEFAPHARAVKTGRAFLTDPRHDIGFGWWIALDPRRTAGAAEFPLHSAITVPLRARGTTLGVAFIARHRHKEPFDSDDLLLAEEVAARAAVCVDNGLRYSRQRATALALQHSLLPRRLPRRSAVDVATRYLPGDTSLGVGGDWFDVIPLSGARVALVVGDVVGRGVHASATMGRLRTAVRTLSDVELPPDELLTHLDDQVAHPVDPDETHALPEADTGEGATCLYAVYDPVSRRCSLACAGHPPPVLIRPDGKVELLEMPPSLPLGVGGLPFESMEVEVPDDSTLFLYTDGLMESRDRDVDQWLDELCRTLGAAARAGTSLDGVCDGVLSALLPERPDDVAVLVARTHAFPAWRVATWEFPAYPVVVSEARERTIRQLREWGLDEAVSTTELVVSELVTNAIRYGAGPVRLRLIWGDTLICEVADGSATAPHLRRAGSTDEGGRGLFLISQVSRRWGTRHTPEGKVIWADQAVGRPRAG
ncbi:SpoIIE family protein phosphatase [Streptomyces sp. NPDC051776]|uniref:SpoIIE family protein phosphatase n=1 Tax=Streptomyces sp. NPDC051776 TaxID=3155414 RepID=UPI003428243B